MQSKGFVLFSITSPVLALCTAHFTKRDLVAEAAGRACLPVMKSHCGHGCFIMTIITADKQLVSAWERWGSEGERRRGREKVIESFGGTFR